ncbi:MAG: MFS transporter [Propionibacteriaceae bacterium]|nr:MFS transporter [Propionibacteriaceae bacterium]
MSHLQGPGTDQPLDDTQTPRVDPSGDSTPPPRQSTPQSDDPPVEPTGDDSQDKPNWLHSISLLLTGQTLSLFGSSVVGYAVIWYITLKTGSGWQYAVMFVAANLAMAVTTIPGGVWADRYWRKALMIGSDAFVAVFTLILALVILAGYEQLWLVIVVLCLRGFATGVQSPALMAAIPQLVPTSKLLRVNSVNSALQALIFVAAPALAAVLLVTLPLGVILLIDVTTALIGISCTIAVKIPRLTNAAIIPGGFKGYLSHMGEAAKYVWAILPLRRAGFLMVMMLTFVMPPVQMAPVIVVRLFGSEQWKLAIAEILWSVGMVLGGVILAVWGGLKNRMTLIMITSAIWGVLSIGLGLSGSIWVFSIIMLLYGTSLPGFQTAAMTSVQEIVPERLLGRTMGFINLIGYSAIPLGMAMMGPLADIVNIRALTIGCGILGLVIIGLTSLDRGPASKLYAPTRD